MADQYENGSYTEVWFREAAVGAGTEPVSGLSMNEKGNNRIYPNPADSQIQIVSSLRPLASLQLLNLAGQCILVKRNLSGTSAQLDLSNIDSGIYLLAVKDVLNSESVNMIIKQ